MVSVPGSDKKTEIAAIKDGQLLSLTLPETKEIKSNFLIEDWGLEAINMPCVTQVGDFFLSSNRALKELNADSLQKAGINFCCFNEGLTEVHLPNFKEADAGLLGHSKITVFDAPQFAKYTVSGYISRNDDGSYCTKIVGLFGNDNLKTNAPFFVDNEDFGFKKEGRVLRTQTYASRKCNTQILCKNNSASL